MKSQIMVVFDQLFMIIVYISIPFAVLRVAWCGLKVVAGQKDEAWMWVKQIIIGLLMIGGSKLIVWFIQLIINALTASHPVGW